MLQRPICTERRYRDYAIALLRFIDLNNNYALHNLLYLSIKLRQGTFSGFVLFDRNIAYPAVIGIAYTAAYFSAASFLGGGGYGLVAGMPWVVFCAFFHVAFACIAWLMAGKIWAMAIAYDAKTVPQLLEKRYNSPQGKSDPDSHHAASLHPEITDRKFLPLTRVVGVILMTAAVSAINVPKQILPLVSVNMGVIACCIFLRLIFGLYWSHGTQTGFIVLCWLPSSVVAWNFCGNPLIHPVFIGPVCGTPGQWV